MHKNKTITKLKKVIVAIEEEIMQKVEEHHTLKLQNQTVSCGREELAKKLKTEKAANEKS